MIMSEKQTAAVERKQRICDRYKGADTAEVEVIPAKPTEALEGKNTILRVAAYVRVSLIMMSSLPLMNCKRIITQTISRRILVGRWRESMRMRESAERRWSIEKGCSR